MSQYLIHATPNRLWYVYEYLIPSMLEQGMDMKNINVFVDDQKLGNLKSWMKSFTELPEKGDTWHIQDDVIISPNFKQITEIPFDDNAIVCGFASELYDKDAPYGVVDKEDMWFSFQCIRIPNRIGRDAVEWTKKYMIGNMIYQEYWKDGKNDDWFFKQYVKLLQENVPVLNLNPNIVDHIDYLIGGSIIMDKPRKEQLRSKYWDYPELVEELEHKLNKEE